MASAPPPSRLAAKRHEMIQGGGRRRPSCRPGRGGAAGVPLRARDLAVQIAGNAPLTNQLILTALARIGDMARSDGFWAEALVTAVSQSTADAEEGLRAFLAKRPPEFRGA